MEFGDLAWRCSPERAALIVVDVQRDFCLPTRNERKAPATEIETMTARLDVLIEAARNGSVPIVFVRTIHATDSDSLAWRSRRGTTVPYADERCRPGTGGEDYFAVSPREEDLVVTKNRYDAFVGTNLDLVLRAHGREALVFCGVTTDVCVETSLRHAICLDYLATLASDCCSATSPELHEQAVGRVEANFGLVATSAEIAKHWD